MLEGSQWMMEQHARSGITHYGAHPFSHCGLVAMYGTFAAGLFPVAERTVVKSRMGIVQQFFACGT